MDQENGSLLMAVDCVKSDHTKIKNAVSVATALSTQMGLLPRAVTIISPKLFNWPFDFDNGFKAAFINFGEDSLDGLFKESNASFYTDVVYQEQSSQSESIISLLDLAKEKNASAIAVFTNARSGHAFTTPGSFISTLISQSSIPVLVINSESKVTPLIKTILLATDFSDESENTAKEAINLTLKLKAKLIIVHVLPTIPRETLLASSAMAAGIATAGDFLFNHEELLKAKGQFLLEQAEKKGVQAEFNLLHSSYAIAETLLESAANQHADLMVLTERTGPWETLLLGSVTRHILSETKLPILVFNKL